MVVLLDRSELVILAVAAAALAVSAFAWRRRRRQRVMATVSLCGLVTALLLLAAVGHLGIRTAGPVEALAAQKASVEVQARLLEDPRTLPGDTERGGTRVVARAQVLQVSARGQVSAVQTPVLIVGDPRLSGIRLWEEVHLRGRLMPAEPGDRVGALLIARGPIAVVAPAGPVADVAEHVRSGMRAAVAGLPADAAGLVPALVIGDRSLTPADLTADMQATGMTHLSAVSGSNVSLILGAALLLCGVLRIPRRWRPLAAGVALAGFVVLARPDPSVLRAAVMGAIGLLGLSSSRRGVGAPALSAAVVVLLVIDPWLARSHGFALSVLATLGLLLFARPWGAALARHLPRRLHVLADATAIPLAAQVTCAPVIVLLQGSISLIGVLANLVAAPFVAPATIAGVVTALVAAVHVGAASLIAWLAALPALAIAADARATARVPFGTLPWVEGTPGALLLAALTVVALLCGPWLLYHARRRPLVPAALLVLVLALAWPTSVEPAPGTWDLVACDVGEGDALLLANGPGHAVAVDVGEDPARIDTCLRRFGVVELDAVVLTHFHADHALGLPGALQGRHVGALYVTGLRDPPENADRVQQWARDAGLEPQPLAAGAQLSWGQVRAKARWPGRAITAGSAPNNASIVLDVETSTLHALLLGDVEREAAREVTRSLRTDPDSRPFDVLKVAHHGSSNLDPALLRLVAAPVALISVGADNDYGHPAPATLTLLASIGAQVLRTDELGDVAIGVHDGQLAVSSSR